MAADDLEPLAERDRRNDLHRRVLEIRADEVGPDAGFANFLKIVNGHSEVYVADALNRQSDRVLARVENAVLAGAVVLELEKVVPVVERVNVFGFAGVNKSVCHNDFLLIKNIISAARGGFLPEVSWRLSA